MYTIYYQTATAGFGGSGSVAINGGVKTVPV